ncbi:S8 family serine peptidase [Pseudonocardia nigra]|uniref:S8 family serine peptidase n=1 Tax=Pseudonocardia nigra TaxID=1921578 RepID=UPI001C5FF032|nr:S8 family serine peptidase [Pseudonocardia nigra]
MSVATGERPGPAPRTGRHLIVLGPALLGDEDASRAALRDLLGAEDVTSTRGGGEPGARPQPTLFAELGVAVATIPPDRVAAVAADERVLSVEPERVLHALGGSVSEEYLRGFRDAAAYLHSVAAEGLPEPTAPEFEDTPELTWGLQATGVPAAVETGAGTVIAVLDTGLDLTHPGFAGREIEARSFVEGEEPQDGHGHGTHCTGTACGPLAPESGRRYGVAHEARILVGKVLSDAGSGTDAEILAGMNWAIASGATVISMSLGADVNEISTAYETVGRRALAAGTLVVAAAGNNASRSEGDPGFVGIPANSPSIMAVGAVDNTLAVADFSARSSGLAGGQVDLAAPGVAVYSSWPMLEHHNTISGTSMATPHVAGIAALWAQRTGATGEALWAQLVRSARRLPLPSEDVGAGLVQAPPP